MINANVRLTGNFAAELIRKNEQRIPEDLLAASRVGAQTAASIAEQRHRTGKMAEIEVLPVEGSIEGWTGGFRSRAWYANFQNKGTKRGIKPLHFLDKGRTVGKADLIQRLTRRLGSL